MNIHCFKKWIRRKSSSHCQTIDYWLLHWHCQMPNKLPLLTIWNCFKNWFTLIGETICKSINTGARGSFHPFQPSVEFYMETSHLICNAINDFFLYEICNTNGLKYKNPVQSNSNKTRDALKYKCYIAYLSLTLNNYLPLNCTMILVFLLKYSNTSLLSFRFQ